MKEILDKCESQPVTESFVNINESDIELRQEKSLIIQVRVRTKSSPEQSIEKWEIAGEVDLVTNKPKNKEALGSAISILLRKKEMDRRKISEAVQSLMHLDTSKDVFAVSGTIRTVAMEQFGSAFKIISGDMLLSQADVTISTTGGDNRGEFRVLSFSSKKEDSIANFLVHLPITEEWNSVSMADYMISSASTDEAPEH
jgi:hypothetical protein